MRPALTIQAGMALLLSVGCVDTAPPPVESRPSPSSPDAAGGRSRGPFVRVLGTAQDGGLPHVACSCERCDLARRDSSAARMVTSLALILPSADKVYLFDVSPDIRPQLDLLEDVRSAPAGRVDRAAVDGAFLTHAHLGHYTGLAFFGFEAMHAAAVSVFASSRMAEFLRVNGPWSQLVELENISLKTMDPGTTVELDDSVSVTAIAAPHRDEYADTLGFIITGPSQRLLYLPDTDSWQAWEPAATELMQGVEVALVDGTFYSADELPGRSVESIGHPLIPASLDLFEPLVSSGRLRVFFTHLNHSNPAVVSGSETHREIERRGFDVLAEGEEFDL